MATHLSGSTAGARWRRGANVLSLARLLAAPVLFAAIRAGEPVVAALLIAFAIATDFADGALARRSVESSALGGLLDHGADAVFVILGLSALAAGGVVPWLLPPLVALAFAQYVIDSRIPESLTLRPSRLGRWNGIAYFVVLAVPLVRDALGLTWPLDGWVRLGGWVLVASTLVSMAERARAARQATA